MLGASARWREPPHQFLARTLRARRVRFTNGRSTLAPVVEMCAAAVGPSASSTTTHARPTPPKIAPAVESTHFHKETPSAANSTARDHPPQPHAAGPDHDGFQVAQIKSPVLDRVHRALRGQQAVLTQDTTSSRRSGCQRAIFRKALFNQCLLAIRRKKNDWRSVAEARRAPHTPPRNATQTAESSTTAAPSDTSRARKSRPGMRPRSRAKRESNPIRSSPQWNHRARRDTAIPPGSLHTGIGAPALEARGANVLRSQLQITQRAHESAAPLAAGLKRLVRMKKTCRLVGKRGRRIGVLPDHRPDPDCSRFSQ